MRNWVYAGTVILAIFATALISNVYRIHAEELVEGSAWNRAFGQPSALLPPAGSIKRCSKSLSEAQNSNSFSKTFAASQRAKRL